MKTSKTVGTKDSNIKMGYEKYAYKSFFRNKDQIYIFGLQMAGIRDQDDMFGVDVRDIGIMYP